MIYEIPGSLAALLMVITSPISSWEKSKSFLSSVDAVFPATCTVVGARIGGTTSNTRGIMIGIIERQLCLYCLVGDHSIEMMPPHKKAMPASNRNNSYRGAT